jgi:hypothetical protein
MPRPTLYADTFRDMPELVGSFGTIEWKALSNSLGAQINPEIRERILAAVVLYVWIAQVSKGRVPLKKLAKGLKRLQDAAESLRGMLSEGPPPEIPASDRDNRHIVGLRTLNAIEEAYFRVNEPSPPPYENHVFWFLLHAVEAMWAVSSWVEREITDPQFPAYSESLAWEFWIQMLTSSMQKHGLPYKVNKSTRKPGYAPSPFVTFIQKLQESLPKEFRRYDHSDDAIAQAIVRARRSTQANIEAMKFFEFFVKPSKDKSVSKLFRLRRRPRDGISQ